MRAIVAFEESDGISGYNHTLEKDALFGLLLAIEMMAVTGMNLSEYLDSLMKEFGHYYPGRSGIGVDRSLTGGPLVRKLSVIRDRYKKGTPVNIGGSIRSVEDLITVDGTKIVLDDGSWFMIRPSAQSQRSGFISRQGQKRGKKPSSRQQGR